MASFEKEEFGKVSDYNYNDKFNSNTSVRNI